MLVVRRALTALIQLVGNLLKIIFYIDLWLRPRKRYAIPPTARALIASAHEKRIPRVVWLTNYTNKVTLAIYVNYLFNRLMAPTSEFRFCGDEDHLAFIKENCPSEVLDCYLKLQIGAARADLWRCLVLFNLGGVYLDIDATLTWPPQLLIDDDQTELLVMTRGEGLTNYFLASAPGQPLLQAFIDRIVVNIKENRILNVFEMTGPGALNAVASKFQAKTEPYFGICKQGLFSNKSLQYPGDKSRYWGFAQNHIDIVKRATPPEI